MPAGSLVLGQNHPNPFADETTVPFTLPRPADVRLTLLDPRGRRVAVIVRPGLGAGEHAIALNLRGLGLGPGAYEYRLQVADEHGEHDERKTMLVHQAAPHTENAREARG